MWWTKEWWEKNIKLDPDPPSLPKHPCGGCVWRMGKKHCMLPRCVKQDGWSYENKEKEKSAC
ncbi:hypothetical protein [Thermoflavimicrobium dichotomicum]|uniref:hypothetical protein n=1 Tax=Thermoflavimicrobium dichotomicum TaxID=46223 RepID=UPI000B82F27A|nr:hypothetical protein [Thermoflavimicrobium dichotomicum]